MSTLQEQLVALGFLDVTGTREQCGGREVIVGIAPPDQRLRRDTNNGTRVVVDDHGHSWVQPYNIDSDREKLAVLLDQLRYGAYVPHSNDGGKFIRSAWPWLFEPQA